MSPRSRSPRPFAVLGLSALVLAAMHALPGVAASGPVPGFIDPFTSSTGSWSGGTSFDNPGTGGVGGAADGYVRLSIGFPAPFGIAGRGAEYTGDWVAAGIKAVRFCLNDINTDEPFEIYFSIGAVHTNFWQYLEGFHPLENAWSGYEVDLTNPAKFTQIIGTGTFQEALQNVTGVHIRHDLPPFPNSSIPSPDPISGDLGFDNFELSDIPVAVAPTTWGRIKRLYR